MTVITRYLIVASVAAMLAFIAAWRVQCWRMDAQINDLKATQAESTTIALRAAARQGDELQRKKDEALDQAAARARTLAVDRDVLRNQRDGLLHTLDAERAATTFASVAALGTYAAALADVFGECAREYGALAEKADGHASDALMFEQAWPSLVGQGNMSAR